MEDTFPILISCKPLKSEFSNFQEIKITSEDFTIGRGLNNSVTIPFLAISRNHCKLKKNNNDWLIEDYSSFGIYINGNKLGKGHRKLLKHQDSVILDASQEFVYKFQCNESLTPCSKKHAKLNLDPKVNETQNIGDDAKQIDLLINKEKNKEQEVLRIKEKQEFEELLRKKTELLRLEKEKELKKLAEQKKQRELELTAELNNIKKNLEKQIERTENEKCNTEKQLKDQLEELNKTKNEDKCKMEQLMLEREEIQKKLIEAQENSKKYIEDLKSRVNEREVELAALAAERIQKQAEQSSEVISSLQEQLEKVRSQLQSVESENQKLIQNAELEIQEAGPSDSKMAKFGEILETELQCSICAELFVSAITLNCSHTFCKYCITMWKKKKKDCPVCRAPISSECKSIVLDSFIEKMVQNLSDEMKHKRQEMLTARQELESELNQQLKTTSRRRESSEPEQQSDWELFEEEEEEDLDEYDFDFGDPFNSEFDEGEYSYDDSVSDSGSYDGDDNPTVQESNNTTGGAGSDRGGRSRRQRVAGVPGSYYGGYGRCYRCGARGHWAPGCPAQRR